MQGAHAVAPMRIDKRARAPDSRVVEIYMYLEYVTLGVRRCLRSACGVVYARSRFRFNVVVKLDDIDDLLDDLSSFGEGYSEVSALPNDDIYLRYLKLFTVRGILSCRLNLAYRAK